VFANRPPSIGRACPEPARPEPGRRGRRDHPERASFYRIFEEHFQDYLYAHEQRFEPRSGPLRLVVRPTVEAFLDCLPLLPGRAPARLLLPDTQLLPLLPGQARRPSTGSGQALFAEKLGQEILPARRSRAEAGLPLPTATTSSPSPGPCAACSFDRLRTGRARALAPGPSVPYRLRGSPAICPGPVRAQGRAARGRGLHPDLPFGRLRAGGSYAANFHPHIHALVTEGVFTPEGEYLPLPARRSLGEGGPALDTAALEEIFRRLLLTRPALSRSKGLHRAQRLSKAFLHNLLGWPRSGFSVWADQVVDPDQPACPEPVEGTGSSAWPARREPPLRR